MVTRSANVLTSEQIARFERDGFLVVEDVLEPGHVRHLSDTLDAVLNRPLEERTPDFRVDRNSTTALRNLDSFHKYWLAGAELPSV